MATASAKLKFLRIAPRKVRLVADLIRGQKVSQARGILMYTHRAASLPLRKLLESAVANADNLAAERGQRIDTDEMVVDTIMVNDGPTMRRFQSMPRGRAGVIRKRSSHVELTISDS